MYLRKISAADRMGSMLLDHFIMCIIIFALSIPLIIVGAVDLFTVSHESSVMNDLMTKILFAIAIAIYLNKDFLNGRSPAKRVIKSQVISNRTNLVASPLLCLIRNFTIILWPIEVIVVLVSPERRLGDYLAGTRVEHLNHEQLDNKPNYKDLPAVLAIGLIFSLLVSFTMDNWFVKSDHYQYVEESYDPEYSTKISYLLNNRFSSIVDSTDVKYYQKLERDSTLSFISLIFYTSDPTLLESSIDKKAIHKRILDTIGLILPQEHYVMKTKLAYKVPGHIRIQFYTHDPSDNEVDHWENSYVNDSIKFVKEYYPNGQLKSKSRFIYGIQDGAYRMWYENGNIFTKAEFVNGKREGITINYHENGQKECELLYKDNNLVKCLNKWDKYGNPIPLEEHDEVF